MKKEYKAPVLKTVGYKIENALLSHSYDYVESKKSGRTFEDEEAAPAAPKKFWDDEE